MLRAQRFGQSFCSRRHLAPASNTSLVLSQTDCSALEAVWQISASNLPTFRRSRAWQRAFTFTSDSTDKDLGAVFLTAPMVVHEDVSARWLFDHHRRLIDIVVDKQTGVY